MTLRLILPVLILVVSTDAFAQAKANDNAPACLQKTVDDVFTSYCGGAEKNPAVCNGALRLTGQAAKLMVVKDYCALSSSKPGWCGCLNVIATPKILAFDHLDEQWTPQGEYHPERPASTFWFDKETLRGVPRVRIGGSETLAVVVARTNPLLFAANLGTPEVADVAELSAAKALLSAAGGALATGFAGAAAFAGALDIAPTPGGQKVQAALEELNALLKEWDDRIKEMAVAADGLSRQWNALTIATQALESKRATAMAVRSLASFDTSIEVFYVPDLVKWSAGLRTLADLHARIGSCRAEIGAPAGDFDTLLKGMKLTSLCPLRLWDRALWIKESWSADAISRAARLLATLTDAQARLAAVLDRKEPIAGSAASLLETVGRLSRYGVKRLTLEPVDFVAKWNALSVAESHTMHLALHLMVAEEAMAGRWDHTQTYPVTISRVKGPLASVISPLRADLAPKYRVEQKLWSTIGFSIGVLAKSTAEVRTWEKTGPENARFVRRTSSAGRAGRVAAFVNYRLIESWTPAASEWPVRPGLELGVAADGTNPGILLGTTLEVARVIRVGWGTSWFVVPELDGMVENGPIAEAAAIRTRSRFKGWLPYASVTFALDSLSLFAK